MCVGGEAVPALTCQWAFMFFPGKQCQLARLGWPALCQPAGSLSEIMDVKGLWGTDSTREKAEVLMGRQDGW